MITRRERDIRRLRQQLADAPVPTGPPPILRQMIERGVFHDPPPRSRVIHPDAERMLREWNEAIARG